MTDTVDPFLRELREALDAFSIADYLDSEGIEYRNTTGTRGEQLNVKCCPVCGGSKFKVYLNAESGLGNCFHGDCEAKFNKFSFIKAQSGLVGKELVEHIKGLSQEFGWIPKKKKVEAVKREVKLEIPNSYEIPYLGNNLAYLENRGVSAEVAKYFGLRFCDKGEFYYFLPDGRVGIQKYDRRVIIPIHDMNGNLVSFQGRDISGEAEKKYLFPPGFSATGAYLYNAHNVKHGTKRILIGEGAFDVIAQKIALSSDKSLADVEPIGTFGKHLSSGADNSQLQKFIELRDRGVEQVTFMWDGEPQALADAIKAGAMVKGLGFDVRIALLPKGKDPNEVPKEVVIKSYIDAIPLTKTGALKLLMQNPYK